MSDTDRLTDEIVALRAIISRIKQRIRKIAPYVVGDDAHKTISEALADNDGLTYRIH